MPSSSGSDGGGCCESLSRPSHLSLPLSVLLVLTTPNLPSLLLACPSLSTQLIFDEVTADTEELMRIERGDAFIIRLLRTLGRLWRGEPEPYAALMMRWARYKLAFAADSLVWEEGREGREGSEIPDMSESKETYSCKEK